MKLLKFTLALSAICFAVIAILLIWSEDIVTCDIVTCKIIETILICCAIALVNEIAKIDV